jgi:hypothetical protein
MTIIIIPLCDTDMMVRGDDVSFCDGNIMQLSGSSGVFNDPRTLNTKLCYKLPPGEGVLFFSRRGRDTHPLNPKHHILMVLSGYGDTQVSVGSVRSWLADEGTVYTGNNLLLRYDTTDDDSIDFDEVNFRAHWTRIIPPATLASSCIQGMLCDVGAGLDPSPSVGRGARACPGGSYCPVVARNASSSSTTEYACPGGVHYCPIGSTTLESLPHCRAGTLTRAQDSPSDFRQCASCTPLCIAATSECQAPFTNQQNGCQQCESGTFVPTMNRCKDCWPQATLVFFYLIIGCAMIAALVYFQSTRLRSMLFRVTINFLQFTAFLMLMNPAAGWPLYLRKIFKWLQITTAFRFDLLEIECFSTETINVGRHILINGGLTLVLFAALYLCAQLPSFISRSWSNERLSVYAGRATAFLCVLLIAPLYRLLAMYLWYCQRGDTWPDDYSIRCTEYEFDFESDYIFLHIVLFASVFALSIASAIGAFLLSMGVLMAAFSDTADTVANNAPLKPASTSFWRRASQTVYQLGSHYTTIRSSALSWDAVSLMAKLTVLSFVIIFQDPYAQMVPSVIVLSMYSLSVHFGSPFHSEFVYLPLPAYLRQRPVDVANAAETMSSATLAVMFFVTALLADDVLSSSAASVLILICICAFVLVSIIMPALSSKRSSENARTMHMRNILDLRELAKGVTKSSYILFDGFSVTQLDECQRELVGQRQLPQDLENLLQDCATAMRSARDQMRHGDYVQAMCEYQHLQNKLELSCDFIAFMIESESDVLKQRDRTTHNMLFLFRMLRAIRFYQPGRGSVLRKTELLEVQDVDLELELYSDEKRQMPTMRTFHADVSEMELVIVRQESEAAVVRDNSSQQFVNVTHAGPEAVQRASHTGVDCWRTLYIAEAKTARDVLLVSESPQQLNELEANISMLIREAHEARTQAAYKSDIAAWVKLVVVGQLRMKAFRSVLRFRCAYLAQFVGADHAAMIKLAAELDVICTNLVSPVVPSRRVQAAMHQLRSIARGSEIDTHGMRTWMQMAEMELDLNQLYGDELLFALDEFVALTKLHVDDGAGVVIEEEKGGLVLPPPRFCRKLMKQVAIENHLRAELPLRVVKHLPGLHVLMTPVRRGDAVSYCKTLCLVARREYDNELCSITFKGLDTSTWQQLLQSVRFENAGDLLHQLHISVDDLIPCRDQSGWYPYIAPAVPGEYAVSRQGLDSAQSNGNDDDGQSSKSMACCVGVSCSPVLAPIECLSCTHFRCCNDASNVLSLDEPLDCKQMYRDGIAWWSDESNALAAAAADEQDQPDVLRSAMQVKEVRQRWLKQLHGINELGSSG